MNMTIEKLEAYLLDHYSNGGVDQSLFMKLAEEIGEVAEVLKKRIGPAANSKECSAFFLGDLQRCGVISYNIEKVRANVRLNCYKKFCIPAIAFAPSATAVTI